MSILQNKIDFTVFCSVRDANPNGDPLNGNRPRTDLDGYGVLTQECIKRKIRNRLQDLGCRVFVQSEDRADDACKSLKERVHNCERLEKEWTKKNADEQICKEIACDEWIDVRAFGQVFALKGEKVSFGVRGPVSICMAKTLSPVDIVTTKITKSVNSVEGENSKMDASRMGERHTIENAVYRFSGAINVQLAEKNGLTEEDAELIKNALTTLFENDGSSARPEGSMEVNRVYWWKHEDKTPSISSAKIQNSFVINKIEPNGSNTFNNYEISWELDGCTQPEIIEG